MNVEKVPTSRIAGQWQPDLRMTPIGCMQRQHCGRPRFFIMDLNPADLCVGARMRAKRIALGVSSEKLVSSRTRGFHSAGNRLGIAALYLSQAAPSAIPSFFAARVLQPEVTT